MVAECKAFGVVLEPLQIPVEPLQSHRILEVPLQGWPSFKKQALACRVFVFALSFKATDVPASAKRTLAGEPSSQALIPSPTK